MQIPVVRRIHNGDVKLHSHLFKYLRKLQFICPFIYKNDYVVIAHARFGILAEQFGAPWIVSNIYDRVTNGQHQGDFQVADNKDLFP